MNKTFETTAVPKSDVTQETYQNLIAFMVCETFIVDQRNLISIINMFTTVQADILPFHHTFWIYFAFRATDDEFHQIKITFKKPEFDQEEEVDLNSIQTEDGKNYNNFRKIETEFEEYGECILYGYFDGKLIGEAHFQVAPASDSARKE